MYTDKRQHHFTIPREDRMKVGCRLDTTCYGNLQSNENQMVSGRRYCCRLGSKGRVVAALLILASAVACGGGGGSTSGRVQVGARLSSSSLTFGNQAMSTASAFQTVTVTSTGVIDLSFSGVTFSGSNAGDFSKTTDTCSGAAVLPNGTCSVSIAFTPTATGSRTATLNFSDNAPASPQSVSLSGTGT